MFEAPINHLEIIESGRDVYNPVLLRRAGRGRGARGGRGGVGVTSRAAVRFTADARARIIFALVTVGVAALSFAPSALAASHGGEGWYGETNDATITNAMFLTIIFFPTVIIIFSLIQWRLDKRKHARMDAAKRRAANADWRGGW